ncbi:hypothetical protein SDC9_123775 [bioreactor metagenome]|uniref:Uncharacterized protein n=1 Tax=bioreactor metagenome TaxID=1076179 RepID=A0A645CIJ7_9ZZZZ
MHHFIQLCFQGNDTVLDLAPVKLKLLLSFASGSLHPSLLPAQARPTTGKAGKGVFKAGKLHLEHRFLSGSTVCKDLQDDLVAVNDRNLPDFLQVALDPRIDLSVENDQIDTKLIDEGLDCFDLAAADQGGAVGLSEADMFNAQRFASHGVCQGFELFAASIAFLRILLWFGEDQEQCLLLGFLNFVNVFAFGNRLVSPVVVLDTHWC